MMAQDYLSPLWISLRTVLTATVITFFLGIAAARWIARYKGRFKSVVDGLFILPMVLPPTVVGFCPAPEPVPKRRYYSGLTGSVFGDDLSGAGSAFVSTASVFFAGLSGSAFVGWPPSDGWSSFFRLSVT